MLDPEGVCERPPLEPALQRSRASCLRRFELELERVDDVVEQVGLPDSDAAEGDVGEMDLRKKIRSLSASLQDLGCGSVRCERGSDLSRRKLVSKAFETSGERKNLTVRRLVVHEEAQLSGVDAISLTSRPFALFAYIAEERQVAGPEVA